MRPQQLLGLRVAEALGERGGVFHIGEEDGDEAGRRRRGCLRHFTDSEELLYDLRGVVRPGG
ncbi:MAG: hypothetical protein ACRDH5_17970 [bacterium]